MPRKADKYTSSLSWQINLAHGIYVITSLQLNESVFKTKIVMPCKGFCRLLRVHNTQYSKPNVHPDLLAMERLWILNGVQFQLAIVKILFSHIVV